MQTKNDLVDMPAEKVLIITRVFDAPRKLVWKAWTDPVQVKNWWGPKTFTCPEVKLEFRIGGKYLCCMRSAEGQDFWTTGTYREIIPMERIVMTDSFSDKDGNIVHASTYGMKEQFPLELLVTLTFEDLDGKTKFTLYHQGLPEGDVSDMTGNGWNEFFDKLEAYLQS